jgi:hypothetical protein
MMSPWLFAVAGILVALGGVYFVFPPVDISPRKCPHCGANTRNHDPFLMCDACEMVVGVIFEATREADVG